jgi:serine protease AprX
VTVIAAAGNDGVRSLVPPATAPQALTVGGLDDKNTFDHAAVEIWHSNYGASSSGASKPELVAPSLWVVAPLLPGTSKAEEARRLFAARAAGDETAEAGIRERHLISPHYHHVDGTSVAAPLVASAAACALQANPRLDQAALRQVLLLACRPVPGAPDEQQGRGALDAGQAVARALRERHGALQGRPASPAIGVESVRFLLHDHDARLVRVHGSWDDWREPGLTARLLEPGLWQADLPRPSPGRYEYKLRLDDARWLDDPDNPRKVPDGFGRLNSVLILDIPVKGPADGAAVV